MRIYFEGHEYPQELISPYFSNKGSNNFPVSVKRGDNGYYVESIGYLFVSNEKYSGPIFILPKTFLTKDNSVPGGKDVLLGMKNVFPKDIIDTENDENTLALQGKETFLPELSLWLFRAMSRYRDDCIKEGDETGLADLDYITPENGSVDRDFLSTAVRLMDYLSDHRNLFTQINKINNSGRAAVDWHKTIQQDPLVKDGRPYYLDLRIKDKSINVDEELIVLYYSVLKYLKNKFRFPISIGDVPYDLKKESDIQRYLDTGIGKRKMRDMKGKYFRDDLKSLWEMLDAFFTNNTSKDDKNPLKEALVIKEFDKVFEKMIDHLIGDTGKLADLKNQRDGKLIDHIYLDKSLIGKGSNIYYIGDSKYYSDGNHPEGVSLYKQFTYARNAIQYNIEEYKIKHKKNPNNIRYRDDETEGYNVTPNFFVVPKIEINNLDFDTPSFGPTGYKYEASRHFEDRLFDRDTLLLREYEINLIFLIAAYGAFEDSWTSTLRKTIREDMIDFLNKTYTFFEIVPQSIPVYSYQKLIYEIPFLSYHYSRICGKAYKASDTDDKIMLAYETNTPTGKKDLAEAQDNLKSSISGGSITEPIKLVP